MAELAIIVIVINSTLITLSVTSSVLKFKEKKEHKKKMIRLNQFYLDELIKRRASNFFIEDAREQLQKSKDDYKEWKDRNIFVKLKRFFKKQK